MHSTTNPVHDRRRRAYEHVPFGARDRPRRRVLRLAWAWPLRRWRSSARRGDVY